MILSMLGMETNCSKLAKPRQHLMEGTEASFFLSNESALDFNHEHKKWALKEKAEEIHC